MPVQATLESRRLLLRPFVVADSKNLSLLIGDHDVSKTTSNIPHPYSQTMATSWIESQSKIFDTTLAYAVIQKNNQALIGGITLSGISTKSAEIGYWIGKPYWNKGYASEALEAIMELAFSTLKLESVSAQYYSSNPASGKVLAKCGIRPVRSTPIKDREGNQANMILCRRVLSPDNTKTSNTQYEPTLQPLK